MGVGGAELGLMSHRSAAVVGVLIIVFARVAALCERLHVVSARQILGPEDHAHLRVVRSPLGIQMQSKDAAGLLQLGVGYRLLIDGELRIVRVQLDVLVIVVGAVGVGRCTLLEVAPTGKRIARTFWFRIICEVDFLPKSTC